MIARLATILTGLCFSSLAGAADIAPQIDPQRLQAHVEFLASDLLEGRAAGSRGYDIAARYVASQLQQLGARPAGDKGTWFQIVPLIEAAAVIPGGSVKLERNGQVTELVNTEDFLPRPYFSAPTVEVTAPVVFVGHGIQAPELGYDDFAGLDIKGKIAVTLSGAPPNFPHSQRAHYSASSNKIRTLAGRGAVGWVIVDTPIDEKRVPWERQVLLSWTPAMRWLDRADQPFEAFPDLKVRFSLSRKGAVKLFAGAPATLEQVFEKSEAGKAQGFDLPVTATMGAKNTIGRTSSMNVVGLIEGSDAQLKNEYVVFTAHLDHIGKGAPVNGDSIYNGAFDNASGTAVMLEMARYFASLPTKPRRSLLFLSVTAEEKGLLGSDYFARQPTVPAGSIVANINMDMPVALTELSDFVAFGAEHSSLGAVAQSAALAEKMTLSPDPMPEEVVFVRSDQYSFVKQGIPALDLDVGSKSRVAGVDAKALVSEWRRTRYHMPGDDLSQQINYPTLAALGRVNARIGLEVANAQTRPTWNRGDFFGEHFAK